MAITLGPPQDFFNTGPLEDLYTGDKRVIALKSDLVVALGGGPPTPVLRAGSVSGDTITWGDPLLVSASGPISNICLSRMSDTAFALVFYNTDISLTIDIGLVDEGALDIDINYGKRANISFGVLPFNPTPTTDFLDIYTDWAVQGLDENTFLFAAPYVDGNSNYRLGVASFFWNDGLSEWQSDHSDVAIDTVTPMFNSPIWTNLRFIKFNATNTALAWLEDGEIEMVHVDESAGIGAVRTVASDVAAFDIDALDVTDRVIVAWRSSDDDKGYALHCSITDSTFSSSSPFLIYNDTTDERASVVAFDDNNFAAIFDSDNAGGKVVVQCEITGSGIVPETPDALNIQGSFSDVDRLTSVAFVYAHQQETTAYGVAYIGTIAESTTAGKLLCLVTYSNAIFTTVWKNSELFFQSYSALDLSLLGEFSLGACSESELNTGVYAAHLCATTSEAYIFGRMGGALGLGHIVSVSGTVIEGGWGEDICGALAVAPDGTIFAVRNIANNPPKLYIGSAQDGLALKCTLPFESGVRPHAIDIDLFTGDVYIAAGSGQSTMVIKVQPPYAANNIINLTYDHDTNDGVNALVLL